MPGAALPLHIFEPRYRQLTVDLITGEVPDKEFGVVAVREGHSADADGQDAMYPVGCTAALLDARRLPDGRYDVVTRGSRRFRLIDMDAEARPYLTGAVEYLPDAPRRSPRAARREARRRGPGGAPALLQDRVALPRLERAERGHPDELAHLLAADCLLPLVERQQLLDRSARSTGCARSARCSPVRPGCSRSCTRDPRR